MHTGRASLAVLVAVVIGSGVVSTAQGAPPPDAGAATRDDGPERPRTVTLVTGDRVTVAGDDSVSVTPGSGRDNVHFRMSRSNGRLSVVPDDAAALLAARRLDARLFDITTLLRAGYDRRPGLPLIVTMSPGAKRAALSGPGLRVTRELPAIDGVAVTAGGGSSGSFWRDLVAGQPRAGAFRGGVTSVYLDGQLRPSLDVSVPAVGAPTAWKAGYRGKGVTVAVIDSGVDATHPDLAGRVIASRNFTDDPNPADRAGHGTHVASTIAGTGAASGRRHVGVAPAATLVSAKVCADGCAESAVVAAMHWAVVERRARVVNVSLGQPDYAGIDPVEAAVNRLTARHGALFVVSAGNNGDFGEGTVFTPASADAALAVGAVTKTGRLADFSGRGPRWTDGAVKPDITAPGVGIIAARAANTSMGTPNGRYTTADGTSMAAPHVAGAAALLAQRHPNWKAPALKAALMASANPIPAVTVFDQGAGRLDVARGIRQLVVSETASVSFGRRPWPQHDDAPLRRTITYRNHGRSAVTLALAVSASGPAGPVERGAFTISPARLKVPARGSARATLTFNARVGKRAGRLGGQVTATATGLRLRTVFGAEKQERTHLLTVKPIGRDGRPAQHDTVAVRLDGTLSSTMWPDNPNTERLPAGRYVLLSTILGPDGEITQLVRSGVDLTAPRTVTLDARLGRPVSVTVPESSARAAQLWSGVTVGPPTRRVTDGVLLTTPSGPLYTAQIGDPTGEAMVAHVAGTWLSGVHAPERSPYAYHLAWYQQGRMFTGLTRRAERSRLATVHSGYAFNAAGASGHKRVESRSPGVGAVRVSLSTPVTLPSERVEYVNTDGGVQWRGTFVEELPGSDGEWPLVVGTMTGAWRGYLPGGAYRERWNGAVFGPATPGGAAWVTRTGDRIDVSVPMWGDGTGRPGWAESTKSRTTLSRDGRTVGEAVAGAGMGSFQAPPAPGRYRLEAHTERQLPGALSTRIAAAWTFRSGHVAGATAKPIALPVIRFRPDLTLANAAPAGGTQLVPLTVDGANGAPVQLRTADVSFDDGRTWTRVTPRDTGAGTVLPISHPKGIGFVSLRATATVGSESVELTVVRAYRYEPPAR